MAGVDFKKMPVFQVIKKSGAGFTMIELLVYLGLFGLLFGGAVAAAYNVVETTGRNQTKVMVQEEGNFLLAKLSWVLSGAQSISSPAAGASCAAPGCALSVAKWDTSIGNPLVIDLAAPDMTLSKGGNPAQTLNNSNVGVSNLTFTHNNGSGDGITPESLQYSFTVSTKTPTGLAYSQNFSGTVYLRK